MGAKLPSPLHSPMRVPRVNDGLTSGTTASDCSFHPITPAAMPLCPTFYKRVSVDHPASNRQFDRSAIPRTWAGALLARQLELILLPARVQPTFCFQVKLSVWRSRVSANSSTERRAEHHMLPPVSWGEAAIAKLATVLYGTIIICYKAYPTIHARTNVQ